MQIGLVHRQALAGILGLACAWGCDRPGARPPEPPAPAVVTSLEPVKAQPATIAKSAPAAETDVPRQTKTDTQGEPEMSTSPKPLKFPVQKSDAEWQALLTPEEYRITRLKGTERAFTGAYWNTKLAGTYQCVCCGRKLFVSDAKFDSGCGWPSFFRAIDEDAIVTQEDRSVPPPRVEIMCSNCGSHLGHVFEDGPPPTGLRFCVNSASVRLVPREAAEPDPN